MNRRQLLAAATAAALPLPAFAAVRTQWRVQGSEGFDAIAFLGPLSGQALYAPRYEAEMKTFGPRVTAPTQAAVDRLQARAEASKQLLWPTLANVLSYGPTDRIDDLLRALAAPEQAVFPGYRRSNQWDQDGWDLLMASRQDLATVLTALRDADFAGFRGQLIGNRLETRTPELLAGLAKYDVIAEQERLIGRTLDPGIGVVLLWFSKPHAASVGGQRSLSHLDYPLETVVRIVAHEMLHPPFPMDGPAATAALEVLDADPLMQRVLKEHDPSFGYNTMEGILNEDTVEAMDQIVSERLGVARAPAARWNQADGGMHILAAGLYGMLKAEGYDRTGGNIERWMADAVKTGKLAPGRLHAAAAKVLEKPVDQLWMTPKA